MNAGANVGFGVQGVMFLAALLPASCLAVYFLHRMRPGKRGEIVGIALMVGAVSGLIAGGVNVIPGLLAEVLLDPIRGSVVNAFITASLIEETAKLAMLLVVLRHRQARYVTDALALGALVSIGFASLENLYYVFRGEAWMQMAIGRALTAVPAHAMFGAMMGYCLVRARAGHFSALYYPLALLGPVLMHGLYDFPLMLASALIEVQRFSAAGALVLGGYWAFIMALLPVLGLGAVRDLDRRTKAPLWRALSDEEDNPFGTGLCKAVAWAYGGIGVGGLIAGIAQIGVRPENIWFSTLFAGSLVFPTVFVLHVNSLARLNARRAAR